MFQGSSGGKIFQEVKSGKRRLVGDEYSQIFERESYPKVDL